ncbi:outer envelope pore protein 16-3, chloroplastic/mitochondrial-like [Primulina tabacum]|uniref:outer envelope pore protein 16-3, chloroplastic/mitochondrial-like n=1 Tax=Primulina tabacum TaxID=48773 RepID=UPI003F5AC91F
MDPRKHRRTEDEGTIITKSMEGATHFLVPGILWGLLDAEQMNSPGLIRTLKITGRRGLLCAATGGLYVGAWQLLEKYRMKRDIINDAGGAFVVGAAFNGLMNRSISMGITGGMTFAMTAVFMDMLISPRKS